MTPAVPAPTPAGWEVVTTAPGVGPDVTGRNVPGHLATVRLKATGAVFQVFVPNADLASIDKVQTDIQAKADQVAALGSLSAG